MAKTTYQLTPLLRLVNYVATILLRMGITIGTTSLLTVRGRKSGRMHTIVVTLVERDGNCWLVAPYGVVNWVRNIRAAKQAILTRKRRSTTIYPVELNPKEAAPILVLMEKWNKNRLCLYFYPKSLPLETSHLYTINVILPHFVCYLTQPSRLFDARVGKHFDHTWSA